MNSYDPISCNLHDYVEIACIYHYEVRIRTHSGAELVGVAADTETDSEKVEWLLLGADLRVALDQIATMTTLTPGAKFDTVVF